MLRNLMLIMFGIFLALPVNAQAVASTVEAALAKSADYDPFDLAPIDKGEVLIYDKRLLQSLTEVPDWRDVDTTVAGEFLVQKIRVYGEWLVASPDKKNVDGPAWDGRVLNKCVDYFPIAKAMDEDDVYHGTFCSARGVLAAHQADKKPVLFEGETAALLVMETLFEHLPMDHVLVEHTMGTKVYSDALGLPEGTTMTWPVGNGFGENVVRLEYRYLSEKDAAGKVNESGDRVSNGMMCPSFRPCLCQFSFTCRASLLGLLAAWRDDADRAHWLLFGKAYYTIGEGMSPPEDFTRLIHIVRNPGEVPMLEQTLE